MPRVKRLVGDVVEARIRSRLRVEGQGAADTAGRVVIVESAAGQHAVTEVGPENPLQWHTNHGRYLAGSEPSPSGTSGARGELLGNLATPASDPDVAWFLHILADAPLPDGVRADPEPGYSATTLCTFIADLTAGRAVLVARDDQPVTIPLGDLAEGDPHRRLTGAIEAAGPVRT